MKKFLLILICALACVGWTDASHTRTLLFGPGFSPMQRGSQVSFQPTLDLEPILFLKWPDYEYNSGGTAEWPNSVSSYPVTATQSVEVQKPVKGAASVGVGDIINKTLVLSLPYSWIPGTASYTLVVRTQRATTSPAEFFCDTPIGPYWAFGSKFTGDGTIARYFPNTTEFLSDTGYFDTATRTYAVSVNPTTGHLKFFKDGIQFGSTLTGATSANRTAPLYICGEPGYSTDFQVKYFMIFNWALSDAEMVEVNTYLEALP